MSLWLFYLFMDGVVRKIIARVGNVEVETITDGVKLELNTLVTLFYCQRVKIFVKISKLNQYCL